MRRAVMCLVTLATLGAAVSVRADDQAAAPPDKVAPIQTQPWTGDLDGMAERRRIRILTPYSRTGYFIDRGQPRGVVAEAAAKLEEVINLHLKTTRTNHVFVIVRPTSREDLQSALIEGRGDIVAAGITVTPDRQKVADFTVPLAQGVKQILVTGPGAAVVNSLDDLSGKYVVVRDKSIFHESLLAANDALKSRGKVPIGIRTVPTALEDEDILEMVSAGLITATVVDDFAAKFWAQVVPNLKLHENIVLRDGGDIAWVVRKNSPKLLAALNPFVEKHRVGTTFGNVVVQRYLKSTKIVRAATSAAELTKFEALRETFEKYGDRYGVDYVLMMAQGYQESRLDQSVKSHVGAIGVMQVMPATGKELGVGNIQQTESNVHAGVKYMRFMIDRYYEKEPMTMLDKMLFAFASYNAGPARIRQLRAEAGTRGLNPNVWLNNVEHLASEKIGRETVQYVSNIYKYYIAYRLALEEAERRKALRKSVGG
jgi:membrane-bound lytic murein transglycosylase MltF